MYAIPVVNVRAAALSLFQTKASKRPSIPGSEHPSVQEFKRSEVDPSASTQKNQETEKPRTKRPRNQETKK